ncbi:hypothetical protein HDU91_001504, partial [Kappamyces sp. JEL0680]
MHAAPSASVSLALATSTTHDSPLSSRIKAMASESFDFELTVEKTRSAMPTSPDLDSERVADLPSDRVSAAEPVFTDAYFSEVVDSILDELAAGTASPDSIFAEVAEPTAFELDDEFDTHSETNDTGIDDAGATWQAAVPLQVPEPLTNEAITVEAAVTVEPPSDLEEVSAVSAEPECCNADSVTATAMAVELNETAILTEPDQPSSPPADIADESAQALEVEPSPKDKTDDLEASVALEAVDVAEPAVAIHETLAENEQPESISTIKVVETVQVVEDEQGPVATVEATRVELEVVEPMVIMPEEESAETTLASPAPEPATEAIEVSALEDDLDSFAADVDSRRDAFSIVLPAEDAPQEDVRSSSQVEVSVLYSTEQSNEPFGSDGDIDMEPERAAFVAQSQSLAGVDEASQDQEDTTTELPGPHATPASLAPASLPRMTPPVEQRISSKVDVLAGNLKRQLSDLISEVVENTLSTAERPVVDSSSLEQILRLRKELEHKNSVIASLQ